KTNVLTHAGSLWSRVVEEVCLQYPDVTVAYQHVDATTIHMVTDPGRFDVIVTDNLFGDIITDLAGAITGGIGLAASGNIDATRRSRRAAQPVRGRVGGATGQAVTLAPVEDQGDRGTACRAGHLACGHAAGLASMVVTGQLRTVRVVVPISAGAIPDGTVGLT